MTEVGLTAEIEPRAKILFFNLMPGKETPHLQIAEKMFGHGGMAVADFRQMAASIIKAKPLKEESGFPKGETTIHQLPMPETITSYRAIVITGGVFSAFPQETKEQKLFVALWKWELIKLIRAAVEHSVPILGICFGEQIIAEALGGKVVRMKNEEGKTVVEANQSLIRRTPGSVDDPVMAGLPAEFMADEQHSSTVVRLPEGGILLAENEMGVQGFRLDDRKGKPAAWGFQFHPERSIGPAIKIFSNFLKYVWSGVQ